ncbi:MAG: TetR/AcrR family transcriptional regulator, partial [Opitutales bacterium]
MPPESTAPSVRDRILQTARSRLFTDGYTALTMDALAAELGMSKKTLYVHFPSKDALVEEILLCFCGEIRSSADAIFNDRSLGFTVRLHRFSESMIKRLQLNPHIFRDLQRSAPHIFRQIEELR